jgi:hypothetical protein
MFLRNVGTTGESARRQNPEERNHQLVVIFILSLYGYSTMQISHSTAVISSSTVA